MDLILTLLKILGASIVAGVTLLAVVVIAGFIAITIKSFIRELNK
jgi:hypothetical protein